MSDPLHGPWKGESKILLSIDVGITHSGVSFMYLKNGAKQTIYPVTKWPGQEGVSIEGMVPTMLWYDTNNKAVSFGAEALSYAVEEQAKDKGWFLAKNFKAHLYPEDTRAQHHPKISALPFDVSLRQVYSDFLGYLLKHTKIFFEERIIDGVQIWETYSSTMEVLMSHPDGWGAREQSFLRDVAVRAGYTTSDRALKNIRFIIDLEASVYRCLSSNNLSNQLKAGDVFILCDADTTSTSISLHKIRSINPMLKIETCTLECLEGGSFSIDVVAERYMRQKMIDAGISPEDMDDFITAGVEDFKKNVKFAFSDETREYLIQITNARFNNPALSTRRGRMALPGSIVKSFFVDYVGLIRQTIDRCVGEVGTSILHLLLVGRFGDSRYLQQVIKDVYEPRGCQISLPTNSASRAVVDGALMRDANANNGYRLRRSLGIETSCGSWLEIAAKGAVILTGTEMKKPVSLKYPISNPKFEDFELKFLSYTNGTEVTKTRDDGGVLLDGFGRWFTLSADLNALREALVERLGTNNSVHWRLNFNVCVRFGDSGLEAYLQWEEKGGTRTIPVAIRPDYEF